MHHAYVSIIMHMPTCIPVPICILLPGNQILASHERSCSVRGWSSGWDGNGIVNCSSLFPAGEGQEAVSLTSSELRPNVAMIVSALRACGVRQGPAQLLSSRGGHVGRCQYFQWSLCRERRRDQMSYSQGYDWSISKDKSSIWYESYWIHPLTHTHPHPPPFHTHTHTASRTPLMLCLVSRLPWCSGTTAETPQHTLSLLPTDLWATPPRYQQVHYNN